MDKMPTRSPYVLIANLLVAGVVGYWMLSVGSAALMVIGTLLAYSAGWTWPGLLHFAVVRDNRLAAASATGVVQTGLSLGAACGPLLFGLTPHVVADGDTGNQRIMVGPLSQLAEATALCERLERVSIACMPGPFGGTPLQSAPAAQ